MNDQGIYGPSDCVKHIPKKKLCSKAEVTNEDICVHGTFVGFQG